MDSSLFHLRMWTQMDRPVSVVLEAKGHVSVVLDPNFLEQQLAEKSWQEDTLQVLHTEAVNFCCILKDNFSLICVYSVHIQLENASTKKTA